MKLDGHTIRRLRAANGAFENFRYSADLDLSSEIQKNYETIFAECLFNAWPNLWPVLKKLIDEEGDKAMKTRMEF